MAWNEPGGGNSGGGKRNPWGNNKPEQGPPDLDEVVRNLQRRLAALFGGSGSNRSGGGGSGGAARGFGIGTILLVLLAIWAFTGWYQVDAAERGVVLRFGKHVATTTPGLRWHWPWPIESRQIVNVQSIQSFPDQTRMLTMDENLVDINLEVQYRAANPLDFAFNVVRPEETLKEVSESAIREIIGRSTLDQVMGGSGREDIVARTKALIQRTLDLYKAGIEITSVNLQDVRVPGEVQQAQAEAIKAGEEKHRLKLQADAYANDVKPRVPGDVARLRQDAEAYRLRKVQNAEGEAQRFLKLLTEYERAPQVTRERLYLETLETILRSSRKVMIDTNGQGNLIYLPLDKLLEPGRRPPQSSDSGVTVERPATSAPAQSNDRRTRGAR